MDLRLLSNFVGEKSLIIIGFLRQEITEPEKVSFSNKTVSYLITKMMLQWSGRYYGTPSFHPCDNSKISIYFHCSKSTEVAACRLWSERWRHFKPIRGRVSRNLLSRNTLPPLYFGVKETFSEFFIPKRMPPTCTSPNCHCLLFHFRIYYHHPKKLEPVFDSYLIKLFLRLVYFHDDSSRYDWPKRRLVEYGSCYGYKSIDTSGNYSLIF